MLSPIGNQSPPTAVEMRNLENQSQLRVQFLRMIDSRRWHYLYSCGLFVDFYAQILAVAFSAKDNFTKLAPQSRWISSIFMGLYVIDMSIRVTVLRASVLSSRSTLADLVCLIVMFVLLIVKVAISLISSPRPILEYNVTIAYLVFVAARLVLKPRARSFSKKLHSFTSNEDGETIKISIASLKRCLGRIPGLSALDINMIETDLVMICGRVSGDMTRVELIQFLERALLHCPKNLSASSFLSYLRDIDAHSSRYAYGTLDVIRSTLRHWSNQKFDLICSLTVICVNAMMNPLQAYFISWLTNGTLIAGTQSETSSVSWGVLGIMLVCIPFVASNLGIGYFQSKMISSATETMQSTLLDTILHQDAYFFASRSDGDLNNLFTSDIARVNALWQSVFWNLLNPSLCIIFGFGYLIIGDFSTGIMSFAFVGVLISSGPQGYAARKSKEFGAKNAYAAAEFQNSVSCSKVIRAYAIHTTLMGKFRSTIAFLRSAQFLKDFYASIVQIYVESAMYIFVATMAGALALKVHRKEISVGDFFAYVTMLSRVSTPVAVLGGFMRVAIGNASSLQRLDDIIYKLNESNLPSFCKPNEESKPMLPKLSKYLELKNLTFQYEKTSENLILNNLSATIFKVRVLYILQVYIVWKILLYILPRILMFALLGQVVAGKARFLVA